jgi:hypothetical protein
MSIFIDQDTDKMVNINAPYKGRSRLDTAEIRAEVGVIEIPADEPPQEAKDNPDYYTRGEDWETTQRPYITYTRKSDDQIASLRWNQIKVKRDDLTDNGGCLVATKWFHSDTKSKQQQMALTMLGASIPANLQWKTMDGTFATMTQTLASQLFGAQIAREQAIFVHAEALKADLNADINTGWPARYEAV